jgi:hypothetical protein
MISVQSNYQKISDKNPNLATYPCLARAVKFKRFSRKSLVKAFKNLMPEDDYDKNDAKQMVENLEILTNLSEEGEN